MIRGKYLSFLDDLSEVEAIRNSVFDNPPPISSLAMNVLVYEENIPVGTGSILYQNDKYIIETIAILSDYRNKGYGEFALRLLADKALLAGAKEVFLSCEVDLQAFFIKYGFQVVEKQDFNMKLILSDLSPKCGGSCH